MRPFRGTHSWGKHKQKINTPTFLTKNYFRSQYVANQQFNVKKSHHATKSLLWEPEKNCYKTSIALRIIRPNTDPKPTPFFILPMGACH
jgi:hypothetical protein